MKSKTKAKPKRPKPKARTRVKGFQAQVGSLHDRFCRVYWNQDFKASVIQHINTCMVGGPFDKTSVAAYVDTPWSYGMKYRCVDALKLIYANDWALKITESINP